MHSTGEAGLASADRRCAERPAPSRSADPWCRGTRVRYPIDETADNLTVLDESPRIGFQALRAVVRWLGSRHERILPSDSQGDAAAAKMAGRCTTDSAYCPEADLKSHTRGEY